MYSELYMSANNVSQMYNVGQDMFHLRPDL